MPTPSDIPLQRDLLARLGRLLRPATTQELAALTGRHANTVRTQLQRMADAGMLERSTVRQARGRPRHEWAIAPDARPGGDDPEAYRALASWLARALTLPPGLDELERLGEAIGAELAPDAAGRPADEALHDALAALGFAPRLERGPDALRFELRTCPYRRAVRENQPAICMLHRGITSGLLGRLAPGATLAGFVPRDPDAAGCLIDVRGRLA